jgi:hypothetical protein
MLADVHFLHFGNLNIRFLHIAPFLYTKYIHDKFGCLEVKRDNFTAAVTITSNRSYLITYAGTKTNDDALCTFVPFYDLTLTMVHISIFIKLNLTLSALPQIPFKYQLNSQYHRHIFDAYQEHVSVRVHCTSSYKNQLMLWHCYLWV